MRDNWKIYATIAACLIALALVGARMKHAFEPQAPAALQYVQHTSPGFLFDAELRHSWKNTEALLAAGRREEKASLRKLVDVVFAHFCRLPKEIILWDMIDARNPGFESMSRVERKEPSEPTKLIGYYTLAGKPLTYDTKVDLRTPTQTLTTVDLEEPLAAGASVTFFRVLRTTNRVTTNSAGKYVLHLGHLLDSPSTLNALGVALPKPAKLGRYYPSSALVAAGNEETVVSWFSTLGDVPGYSAYITFTIPK